MKTPLLGFLCVLVAATTAFAADEIADKVITRSFPAQRDGQLTVTVDSGDVEVLTTNQATVVVVVERDVTGGTESQATKLLKAHKVTFSQEDNEVRVRASSPKASRSTAILHVHFKITVPRNFNVNLDTAGGNIQVTGLRGVAEARSAGGNLTFTKIEGAVTGHTGGGNVIASGCTDKLEIQSSGGNLTLDDFSGPAAQLDSSGGNISAANCAGKLAAKTTGGNIFIDNFSGPSAYGDTSGGTIAIDLAQQPAGDCFFRSSGGNITAKLAENLTLNLKAMTDAGTVNCQLPVTETSKQTGGALEGKINGGGPVLALRTSGGNIQVQKR